MTAEQQGAADRARHADRARQTAAALRRLRDEGSGLYHEPRPPGGRRPLLRRRSATSLWPYANAWVAMRCVALLDGDGPEGAVSVSPPGLERGEGAAPGAQPALAEPWRVLLAGHVDPLARYAARGRHELDGDGPLRLEAGTWRPPGGRGDAYYDDDSWIALALLAQHELTGDERCLRLAGRVLEFVLSGWSEERSWASPGGIRWAEPAWSRSRNACANAPAAEAAALACRAGGDERLLAWSRRILAWTDATLRDESGCYADRIDPDGTLHAELWAYNQGTALGSHVVLHELGDGEHHLELAVATARAARRWLERPGAIDGQPAEFLAIYLRNVLLLAPYADVSESLAQVARRADAAWERDRTAGGLFSSGKTEVNRTAGMAAVYALLAGARPLP